MPTFTFTSLFTNDNLTRANFITNLRTRVDEDTADTITDIQIQSFIRQGNYDICFRTKLLPEYATVSLDGSSSYTLPEDMVEIGSLYFVSTDSPARYTLIEPTNLQELTQRGYDTGSTNYYIRNGQNIEIFGNTPITGTFRAYGTRIPTFPATDGAFIDIPNQYLELMYLWCEWKFWVRRREPDEAAIARDIYFNLIKLVAGQLESQYQEGLSVYGNG